MAQDLRLKRNDEGIYDLTLSGKDFEKTDSLETSIIVSIGTDARANASQVQDRARRRGWVGDIRTSDIGRSLGSVLWLYKQAKMTQETRNGIQDAATNALSWMVEDGVARGVDVSITDVSTRDVTLLIRITTVTGQTLPYSILWRRFDGSRLT